MNAAIRTRMHQVADQLERHALPELAKELHELAEQSRRRRPIRRAPDTHRMTADIAAAIRYYADAHPNEGMFEIGERFGVNQGRVSEVLNETTHRRTAPGPRARRRSRARDR